MEKLRIVLEVLKKYHFWILCGLIVLLCFVTWFLATGDQEKRFATKTKDLDGKITQVKTISQMAEHPSVKYIQEIRDITGGPLTKQVETASNRLYDEQRKSNPLPIVFPKKEEQERFEAAFEKIWGRMEDIEKLPPDALLEFYRSRYRNHITEHFPQLFKLIERRTEAVATDPSGQAAEAGFGPADLGDPSKKFVGIVNWDDADQKMRVFSDRFSSSTPTTLDIMMAQEDLWVYETLLKVIRNTNDVGSDPTHRDPTKYKKPESHKLARIKQILAMDIGADAIRSWSSCDKALINLGTDAAGGAAPSSLVGSRPMAGASLLAGRYVDQMGKPLADPTQQPFNEFRMMPINLKVIIEQREIPRFLAECANSAMRIDVRRVRLLAETPPPLDTAADTSPAPTSDVKAGPAPTPGPPQPTERPFMGRRPGLSGQRRRMAAVVKDTAIKAEAAYLDESSDPVYPPVTVEVQGIIYIYNPPPVQNAAQTPGSNNPQAAPAVSNSGAPANSAPAVGVPAAGVPASSVPAAGVPATPATRSNPAPGAVPAGPAAPGSQPTITPKPL